MGGWNERYARWLVCECGGRGKWLLISVLDSRITGERGERRVRAEGSGGSGVCVRVCDNMSVAGESGLTNGRDVGGGRERDGRPED